MVVLNLGFPVYGSAVINAAMAGALHFDRKTLGLVFSVYMIMSGLPGPLVAISVNRFGVRRTLVIGSAFVIAGAVLMATVVSTGLQAALAFGVLVGTGVATGAALASQAGVAKWFVRRQIARTDERVASTHSSAETGRTMKPTTPTEPRLPRMTLTSRR